MKTPERLSGVSPKKPALCKLRPALGKALYSASKSALKILGRYPNEGRTKAEPGPYQAQTGCLSASASRWGILRFLPIHVHATHFSEIFMADLKKQFEAAAADSKNLTERPDNATMLKLYALFKQGSIGDNTEKKPGFTDMVGRAKWDAWNGMKGTANTDAMQQYIDLVKTLS
jgi:diazepam-binding inhibitor (GABA receptor modulator, acyl-CoA-binding protein)